MLKTRAQREACLTSKCLFGGGGGELTQLVLQKTTYAAKPVLTRNQS